MGVPIPWSKQFRRLGIRLGIAAAAARAAAVIQAAENAGAFVAAEHAASDIIHRELLLVLGRAERAAKIAREQAAQEADNEMVLARAQAAELALGKAAADLIANAEAHMAKLLAARKKTNGIPCPKAKGRPPGSKNKIKEPKPLKPNAGSSAASADPHGSRAGACARALQPNADHAAGAGIYFFPN
jgi:hypothetical protein